MPFPGHGLLSLAAGPHDFVTLYGYAPFPGASISNQHAQWAKRTFFTMLAVSCIQALLKQAKTLQDHNKPDS
ncbi:hypothetical protein BGC31_10185 [Komagataeibacter xylinus]|nr:hypothetical protein BGC31_10185 [Komagataeibacter xylinus]RFP04166.1 hypothetical protein BFX83_08800 [Komagataeibacter xylinus]